MAAIPAPTNLRCEYALQPLGVDTQTPRFLWNLQHATRGQDQSAYQIIVSSEVEDVEKESGNVWDSGKFDSSEMVNAVYGGCRIRLLRFQC